MSHLEFLSMSENSCLSRARSKKRKRLKKVRKKEVQLTDNSMLAPKLQEESVRFWVRNFNKPPH